MFYVYKSLIRGILHTALLFGVIKESSKVNPRQNFEKFCP